jgi:hypothetical protein
MQNLVEIEPEGSTPYLRAKPTGSRTIPRPLDLEPGTAMAGKAKQAGIALGTLLAVAAVVFVFVTPYNRTPGVRLGGTLSGAPTDWRLVNDMQLMQLKPAGLPPFVVNVWYVGTADGVITATRPDGGYWGRRVRANPNARVRIGDVAYEVTARQVLEHDERRAMLSRYVDKYGLEDVPGMRLEDLANPSRPWEVFFWTAR